MPWAYLDDHFDEHPKVSRAGPEAAWLFVRGLLYCRRNLTGGLIPAGRALELAGNKRRAVDRLVSVRLWERDDGDLRVHDYEQWNHSEKKARQARSAAQKRWADHADASANGYADAHADALPDADAEGIPAHARAPGPHSPSPRPVEQSSSSGTVVAPPLDDDELRAQTWRVLAVRRLAKREAEKGAVGSREKWLTSVAAGMPAEHGDEMNALLTSEDGWTPELLADALEPVRNPAPRKPSDPMETTAAAAAELRRRQQLPPCETCDSARQVESDDGTWGPCPDCSGAAA